MKRYPFLIAVVFLLCLAPPSHAQQFTGPDDATVSRGVYTNRFFGFSVTYPKDWVVHGDATNVRLREIGKERATSTGAMSAATSEVVLRNTYQLLTTFQYPMGSAIEVNPGFMLVAERVSHAPAIVTGRDYLLHVRPLMLKTGVVPVGEPVELTLAGRQFFRQDSRMEMNGISMAQTIIITVTQGFALAFILSGKDQAPMNEMINAVATLKFTSTSPPIKQPAVKTKSKPRPRPKHTPR